MKKIKRCHFETGEEFARAFKAQRLEKKEIEKKRKWAKYQRVRRRKISKKKKSAKKKEERKKEKQKQKEKDLVYPYFIKDREFDFLKYRFVVDRYFRKKFFKELTMQEFELLFFIYSEPAFTKVFFHEIERAFSWNNQRLEKFLELDILRQYEQKHEMIDKRYAVRYVMTRQCAQKITLYYKALTLCYEIPTYGKMFQPRKQSYIEMKLSKLIELFNVRLIEHHNEIAFSEDDQDRFSLEQRTFKEIYDEFKKTI